jgi:hypothetical protein
MHKSTLIDIENNKYRDKIKQILWENTRINLIINLRRNDKEIRNIKFIVSPSEYEDIMNLRGAHCGTLINNNQDIVINFFPSDILIIVCNDYLEVKKNFDKKAEEYNKIEFFK